MPIDMSGAIADVFTALNAGNYINPDDIARMNNLFNSIVNDLLDLALYSHEGEWEGQVLFIPL